MEFPVIECIETCFALVNKIATAVENVKSFKKLAKRLSSRIESLLAPTRALFDRDRDSIVNAPPVYQNALQSLQKCLNDIQIFLLNVMATGKVKLFFKSEDIKNDFDEFNNRLTALTTDLQLGVTTHSVTSGNTFAPQRRRFEDRRDEANDIADALKYIRKVQQKINFDEMSEENRIHVHGMFIYLKSQGDKLHRLRQEMEAEEEDMADDDDEDLDDLLPPQNTERPTTVVRLDNPTDTKGNDEDAVLSNLKWLAENQNDPELKELLESA